VTVSGNTASRGGGMFNYSASPIINNTIIYNNSTGVYNQDAASDPAYQYSLVQDNPSGIGMVPAPVVASEIFVNPQTPGLNIGGDYSLIAGSPAINAGSNQFVIKKTDLAGNARIRNNMVDLGAYEVQTGNTITVVIPNAGIIYVKQFAKGTGNSWANALPELADALVFAKTNNAIATNPQVTQIWVAGGIYKPMYSLDDGVDFGTDKGRFNTFLLVKDVKIYGGFAGTESTLAERDLTLTANKSILSGDLSGDDGVNFANNGENTYHVVLGAGAVGIAEVNGFTVSGGNGNGSFSIQVNSLYFSGFLGGAFYNQNGSSPVLTNVIISGNSAYYGGAFYNENSSPVLTNVSISGNSTPYNGGAFFNQNGSSPVLTNVTISGNSADYGGAFLNMNSSPVLTNVTISGNSATAGGAFYNNNSFPKIRNSIIYNNDAADIQGQGSVPAYLNSIVQGNPTGTDMVPYSGDVINIFVDPQAPGVNAGGDYRLRSGSPAINKGNNTLFAGLDANTKDLAGNLRLQKGAIDLGAYESPYSEILPDGNGILYVKKGETGNGGSWTNALGELADALVFAKNNNAIAANPKITQIWAAGGIYKPLYSPADDNFGNDDTRNNAFLLVQDVKIYGGFAGTETTLTERNLTIVTNKSILSGDLKGDDGANFANNSENTYHVVISAADVATAELNGFTISGANLNGAGNLTVNTQSTFYYIGGGIYNTSSSPVLTNLTISGNIAGTNGAGGGMSNVYSSPVLTNVTISGNVANGLAGGMLNYMSSSPVLTNVTISSNVARALGGGMFNIYDSSPQIKNCIIYNNGSGVDNSDNSIPVYQHSLVQDMNAILGVISYLGPANTIFINPENRGLSTGGDYRLKAGSPALNAGSNTFFAPGQSPDLSTITTDLAGKPRFNGAAVDLGAYELQSEPQSINPISNVTKTYGDQTFEPGGTSTSGLILTYASADPSIAETYQDATDGNKWKIKIKKVGTVTITASQLGDTDFDPALAVDFNVVINKKPITINLNPAQVTKTYDANTNAVIGLDNLSFTAGSIVGTDDVSIAISSTTATYDDKNVGTGKLISIPLANLKLTGTAAGNYNIVNTVDIAANVGTITAKALTIKANNQTKIYDSTPYSGGNDVNYNGFATGDKHINSLTGVLEYGGSAQQAIAAGTYAIEPKGYSATNYSIIYESGVLTIAPSTVNVLSFNVQQTNGKVTKVYGNGSINAAAAASSNLSTSYQSNNTAVAAVNSAGQVEIKGTGTVVITASQSGNSNYNPAIAISLTIEVVKKTLDVKAKDDNKTFNNLPYTGGNGLIYSGFAYGENESLLSGTPVYLGNSQGAINTGSYPIIPSGLTATNYNLNYISGLLTVQAAGNNVILFNSQANGANLNVTYGDGSIDASATATSGLLVTYESSNPQVATVAANGTATILSAGTSTITASQAGNSNNMAATPVSFTLTVQKKLLTITANNWNKVYDGLASNTGNDVTYTGFATGEGKQQLTGTLSYSGTAIGAKNVGSYFISPNGYSSENYAITYQDGSLTITKAGLTIKADAVSKMYGAKDPALSTTVMGLIGTDKLNGALQRAVGENVGTYAISQGTLSAGANYTISYTSANLVIGSKTISVVADAKTKVYGDAEPPLTYSATGLVGIDKLTGSLERTTGENVGTYAINQNTLSAGANYTISFTPANLVIGSKTISVVADAKTKVYGDNDPALTYSATGLVGTDKLTGSLERTTGENVGTYPINQGNLSAGANYTISYTPANLTIGIKAITIIADAKSKVYGAIDPTLTYSATGMVGTDKITGSLERVLGENVGSYAINQGNLSAGANYTISYTSANLVIGSKAITVIADAKTKVYGDAEPPLTYSATGLVGTDKLTGSLERTTGENVGSYAINQNDISAGANYTISYTSANLVIGSKAITVIADAKTKVYGASEPPLTYSATGLVGTDKLTGSLERTTGENVGTYSIKQNTLSAGANYFINYTTANLTIGTKALTIIADAKNKTYGDSDPELTYGVNGLLGTDKLNGALQRAVGENVGTYPIKQNNLSAGANYTISYTSANLVIGSKAITVIADAKTKVYGASEPPLTYSAIGLVGTDKLTGSLERITGENVGLYPINQNTLSAGANYTISYTGADLAIGAKAITVIADAKTKVYGASEPPLTYSAIGLVGTDKLTGSLERTTGENVGTYTINQNHLSAGANYTISYTSANLVIGSKAITIIGDAKTKVYGDAEPPLTYSATGLVGTDKLTGSLERTTGENVGTYTINQNNLSAGANYTISYTSANLVIGSKAITVIADAKTKAYGDTDPGLTYKVVGLLGSDKLTGSLERTVGENVGSYAINQNNLSAGANYTISYTSANLVIGTKAITVVADAKTKVYGDSDPALTYVVNGMLGTDKLTGALQRSVGENMGTYAINQGPLSAGANYTISYTGANLVIGTKAISVVADAKTKVYGDSDPALSYVVSGLLGTDKLTGNLQRAVGENVGAYLINQGTLFAGANYTINYTTANLNITKVILTVAAEDKQVCQGNVLPPLTIVYTGFRFNDNITVLSKRPAINTIATGSSPAGNYTLSPSEASSNNYSFNYVTANLTIYAKPVSLITSNKPSQISKGETVILTASGGTTFSWGNAEGIISGQQTAVLTVRPTLTTTYVVTVVNANGCTETSSITIEVNSDFQAVKANNILTPNGDGINDVWVIANIDVYPNNVVTVFDKGGRIIFTQKGYHNTWDGTVNGSPLAEDTYYYIIDFGTDKLKQKGFITLIRQQ